MTRSRTTTRTRAHLGPRGFAAATALALFATLLAALAAHAGAAQPRARAEAQAHAGAAPVVATTSGRLQGLATGGVREFLGVRYAKPPVGELRWAPPQPAPAARGLVKATKSGANCPQSPGVAQPSQGKQSEDCLFLNVTEPRGTGPGAHLPVMVWWHGGGYNTGGGAEYNADRLASQGHVIVVTVSMRLGIFGYLGLPGLRGGGDFGLEDSLLATRWAKRNARAFGGDPGNVTVFGESSGAMSACAALTSPRARGLIDKVALSSGSCRLSWPTGGLLPGTPAQTPYVSAESSHALGLAIADKVKCPPRHAIACMRKISAKALRPLNPDFSNVLAYGTPALPRDPAVALARGDFLRVPIVSGGNRNEESSFVAGSAEAFPGHYTAARYPKLLAAAFGAKAAAKVAARYPLASYPSPAAAFAAVITDSSWACPTLTGDDQLARRAPVYAYEFDDPASPNVNGVEPPGIPVASAHATDLPYLFDLLGKDLLVGRPSHQLARTMVAFWTSFARDGRPSAPGAAWPRYQAGSGRVLQLRPGAVHPIDFAGEHQCGFWRGIGS